MSRLTPQNVFLALAALVLSSCGVERDALIDESQNDEEAVASRDHADTRSKTGKVGECPPLLTNSFSLDVVRGEAVYIQNCARCHDNQGGNAPDLKSVTYSDYPFFRRVVVNGTSPMPAFRNMIEDDIQSMFIFLNPTSSITPPKPGVGQPMSPPGRTKGPFEDLYPGDEEEPGGNGNTDDLLPSQNDGVTPPLGDKEQVGQEAEGMVSDENPKQKDCF